MPEKPTYKDLEQRVRELEAAESEREQAQEALRASKELYRILFEQARDVIYYTTPRGDLIDMNDAGLKLLGYPREEFKHIDVSNHYADPAQREEEKQELQAKGFIRDKEIRLIKKDGSEITCLDSATVLRNPDGSIKGYIGTLRDVTLRKQTEKALQESEARYRKILESMVDGYYEIDLAGNFVFFNDSACELLGYSREEILGMNYRQYTDEQNANELYHAFNEVHRTGKPTRGFDWEVVRKDGSRRFVEASVTLIHDAEGNAAGFRGIARDVTDRKHMEAEQEKLRQKLQQAQKMESIGTLAGGIAHNFNNVLMGIQGRASLMMMNKGPSHPDYEHLKGIEKYIRNATELSRDLLGFARGGKYEVKPTDLNELIDHEIRMFGHTKKEIRIHGKYDKHLWTSDVDQGQIRQVFLNLYVNAWQAMPGGGDLYVQTENAILSGAHVQTLKVRPGRYVKISVTDTGTGMDEVTRQKIFDPFFSTKGMERGSGLGLASVYGIVQNHGGIIQVVSEKGKGTTFELYLPASEKPVKGETLEIDQQKIEHGSGTVLLVDDEDMVLEVGQMMLEKLGYRVRIARSGKEAIDLYWKKREEINLVILDMIMPGMGGGETYDRLKAIDPDATVLLSSGYSMNGQAAEIMDRGCDGFIQKPFAMEELSQKVKKVFSG